jgi:pimeloyl-ACP methyl ester carboxylesterase
MPIPDKGLVYTGSRNPRPAREGVQERSVQILLGESDLVGDVAVPEHAKGFVMFAHGSGSSRLSPRNRFVAGVLQNAGLATLLIDLLTVQEDHIDRQTMEFRFNIGLLAERLMGLPDWHCVHRDLCHLPLAYFGASTGSAAALIAAANRPEHVRAIVSRGGRPDLAASSLPHVQAPTLLIVGGDDASVIELNQQAFEILRCEKRLEIVPGATHLFEESGALERVAQLDAEWYRQHMR